MMSDFNLVERLLQLASIGVSREEDNGTPWINSYDTVKAEMGNHANAHNAIPELKEFWDHVQDCLFGKPWTWSPEEWQQHNRLVTRFMTTPWTNQQNIRALS